MKKYLLILPLIVLPIVGYSYFNNQTKKQDNKTININNTEQLYDYVNSNTLNIEPVKYYSVTTEVELVYKHCDKCKIGVYLPSDDGITKCTHCANKENN